MRERASERRVEWPTVVVAATIAATLASTLVFHEHLPVLAEVAVLGVLAAWYNSLQHEVIHGHPTRWAAFNTILAIAPIGLVVPFRRYRTLHREHHLTADLTDPSADPESFYVTAHAWASAGTLHRGYLTATRTLLGRMLLGPPVIAARWLSSGLGNIRTWREACHAAAHVAAVAAVLLVVWASGMSLWTYALAVVWVGGALSLLRSFAEHRMTDAGPRSAVVRSGRCLSLLFLNNNLHHTHHLHPGLPWFDLAAADAALDADELRADGTGVYAGYGEVARRYLLRPFDAPVHPATTMVAWSSNTTPTPAAID